MAFLRSGVIAKFPFVTLSEGKGLAAQVEILRFAQNDKQLCHPEQPFDTLSEGKGLSVRGGILRFAQNDRQLCHPEQPFGTLSEGKGLAAQVGILRFAQNDRQHFLLFRTGVDIGGLPFL